MGKICGKVGIILCCVSFCLVHLAVGDWSANPFFGQKPNPFLQKHQPAPSNPAFTKTPSSHPFAPNPDQIYFPDEDYSDSCLLNGDPGTTGVCRSFMDCPKAVKEWEQFRKKPQRCYLDGFIQYVCCDDESAQSESPILRQTNPKRSATACEEEDDFVHITVTNGEPALPNEFPFMASLGWTSPFTEDITYLCGGALFSPRYVLTAAHCTRVNGDAPKVVRLGDTPLNATKQFNIFDIKRLVSHPEYNGKDLYNDIAVIELEGSTGRFKPACIWLDRNYPTRKVTAIGYGQTQFAGPSSNILIKADIFLTPNNECSGFYPKSEDLPRGLLDSQVCAGDPLQRRDTCQGDSGGPMVVKVSKEFSRTPVSYIVGLTSFGQACGGTTPGIYTRVADYIDWIEEIVWPRGS